MGGYARASVIVRVTLYVNLFVLATGWMSLYDCLCVCVRARPKVNIIPLTFSGVYWRSATSAQNTCRVTILSTDKGCKNYQTRTYTYQKYYEMKGSEPEWANPRNITFHPPKLGILVKCVSEHSEHSENLAISSEGGYDYSSFCAYCK